MKTIALVLTCALPLAAQTGARQADSAKAAAVVARHTAAVGGAAAFRALTHLHTVMTTSMPGTIGAPEVRAEVYAKAPNLVYIKMDMPGVGPMEMGYDGKTAWSLSVAAGPMVHDDIPQQLIDAANFGAPPLDGLKVSYGGRREIGGRTFDVVRAQMPDDQTFSHYFDVRTGLLAGMDPDGMPPVPDRMVVSFDDYKRFGAILHATRVTTVAQGQEVVMRTVSISHAPFDSKIFDPPPQVRQLRTKPPER